MLFENRSSLTRYTCLLLLFVTPLCGTPQQTQPTLSEVKLWAIPTGTGITEAEQQTLLGKAKRVNPAGRNEKWILPIPSCSTEPILATTIYASGFDDHGRYIGSKSLPYSGATEIYKALCGKRQQRFTTQKTYKSPDASLVAVVRSVKQPEATDESEVRVQTASGKVLARRDYRSEDGEHGFGVTKAQWTPDSQFFVYSLENSGGHQPWHSPVQYFSRTSGGFVSLDDALNDAVMNPQFSIEAPDKVTVELYFGKKTSTVSLSSLAKIRHAAK